jgi:uncharacterized protein (DUF433 family)
MGVVSIKNKMGGEPIIKGTKVTIDRIVRSYDLEGVDKCAKRYGINIEQVREAIEYCAGEKCVPDENGNGAIEYCIGCYKRDLAGELFWERAQILFESKRF